MKGKAKGKKTQVIKEKLAYQHVYVDYYFYTGRWGKVVQMVQLKKTSITTRFFFLLH